MPTFQTSRRVGHTPDDMFALVADVEKYPEFVPLCKSLVIRSREDRPDGTERIVADMTVAYKLLRETFTTKVTLDRAKGRILVEYINGPFRYMETRWTFVPNGNQGTEVGFFTSYEFRSRTLAALVGAVFEATFRRFADAFEKRANVVYGTPKPALV